MPEFGVDGRVSDKNLSTMWMIVDEPFWVVTEVTEEDIIVDKTDLNSQLKVDYYLRRGDSDEMAFIPHARIASTTLQSALEELIDENTVLTGTSLPSSPTEGQLFYDTDDNIFRVYKETTWTTLAGSLLNSMTTVSGGAF